MSHGNELCLTHLSMSSSDTKRVGPVRSGVGEVGGSGRERGRRELAGLFIVTGVCLWGARKSSITLYIHKCLGERARE